MTITFKIVAYLQYIALPLMLAWFIFCFGKILNDMTKEAQELRMKTDSTLMDNKEEKKDDK